MKQITLIYLLVLINIGLNYKPSYSIELQSLIDFNEYERRNQEADLYAQDNEYMRKDIYQYPKEDPIPQIIDSDNFEKKILTKILRTDDRDFLLSFYEKNESGSNYILKIPNNDDENSKISATDKSRIFGILQSAGYNELNTGLNYIPWFKITYKDVALNRWAIDYRLPKKYKPLISRLTKKARINFENEVLQGPPTFSLNSDINNNNENNNIEETQKIDMLGSRITFPKIEQSLKAIIRPPYEIYQYSQKGKIINLNNGVLNNVGKIEKISVTVGFKGNVQNHYFYLRLQDKYRDTLTYPMGYLKPQKKSKFDYFSQYNGKLFRNEDKIEDQNQLNEIISSGNYYYKAFYTQNIPETIRSDLYNSLPQEQKNQLDQYYYFDYPSNTYKIKYPITEQAKIEILQTLKSLGLINPYWWIMYRKNQIVYQEVTLQWTNSDYLPPERTMFFKRRPNYPDEIPYIKLDSFVIEKREGTIGSPFDLFIKNVQVKYDIDRIVEDLDIDDDQEWHILSQYRKKRRKKLELINASRIYSMMKQGWKMGLKDYLDFKENYFLRYPPQRLTHY